MPLDKSGSKASVGTNIKREQDAGRPHKQAIAIALSVQRKAKGEPDWHSAADKHHPVKR